MPFKPSDLGYVWSWHSADVGVFQDAGLTVPVVAEGQDVVGWQDRSGNGRHMLGGGGLHTWHPTLGPNSKPAITLESGGLWRINPATLQIPFTYYLIGNPKPLAPFQVNYMMFNAGTFMAGTAVVYAQGSNGGTNTFGISGPWGNCVAFGEPDGAQHLWKASVQAGVNGIHYSKDLTVIATADCSAPNGTDTALGFIGLLQGHQSSGQTWDPVELLILNNVVPIWDHNLIMQYFSDKYNFGWTMPTPHIRKFFGTHVRRALNFKAKR